jgi:hypothetical protein
MSVIAIYVVGPENDPYGPPVEVRVYAVIGNGCLHRRDPDGEFVLCYPDVSGRNLYWHAVSFSET